MKIRASLLSLVSIIFALAGLSAPLALAQSDGYVTNSNLRGVVDGNTYHFGTIDNVNLGTGALNIAIPLFNQPGRGWNRSARFVYSSKIWVAQPGWDPIIPNTLDTLSWQTTGSRWAYGTFDFSEHSDLDFQELEYDCEIQQGVYKSTMVDSNFVYNSHGAQYQFPNRHVWNTDGSLPGGGNCAPRGPLAYDLAYSDSGTMQLDTSQFPNFATVTLKDGRKDFLPYGTPVSMYIEDTNGNFENSSGDTLLRTVTGTADVMTIKDSNGNNQSYTLSGTTQGVAPAFPTTSCGGAPVIQNPSSVPVFTSLVLPNGWTYTFSYIDPKTNKTNPFGEIMQITLPSGGYIRYDYMILSQYDNGAPNLPCKIDSRRVAHRYLSPDGTKQSEQVWTYSYSTSGYTTTVTDPAGNDSVHTFEPTGMHETQAQYYSGTGTSRTLLKTVANTWVSDSGAVQSTQQEVGTCGYINWRTTQSTTTLNDTNQADQVQTDYNTFTYSSPYSSCGNATSRLNPTETREYDWGPNGSPGPLLRRTDFTYLQDGNSNYLNLHIWDRPASKYIYNGSGTQAAATTFEYDNYTAGIAASGAIQHDPAFNAGAGYTLRGNLTASSLWRNTDGAWLLTRNQYDDAGNILSTADPLGNLTTFSFADNFTDGTNHNAQAFVTQVTYPATNGVNHIERKQYYFNTALLAATCGQNFPSASACKNSYSPPQPDYTTFTYDLMNRPVTISRGDGGSTSLFYHDYPLPLSASSTVTIGPPGNLVNTMILDGLGRVNHTQLNSDPCGIDYTDVGYDVIGRKSTVSNPYRTSDSCNMGTSTTGTTTYQYDALSRPSKTIPPDGSSSSDNITYAYSGNCTTVTDQAAKSRKTCSDGLGRLIQVLEDPAGLIYETDYTYDTLGNLLTVNQKGGSSNSANWRTRTFTYDSLSRLLCASNPENSSAACPAAATSSYTTGTTGYAYDLDGNLSTKTALAPNQTGTATVVTSYSYDALNRLTQKSYNDNGATPTLKYGYDGVALTGCATAPPALTDNNPKGLRTAMCDGAGAESWSHDVMGRTLTDSRITNSVPGSTVYTYLPYLDGSINTILYPSTRTLTYSTGSADRLLSVQDNSTSVYYASSATYAPQGALSSLTNGPDLYSTHLYNSRLQPCWLYTTTGTALPASTSCTGTATTGNILDFKYNFNLGVSNNGNVAGVTNNRDTTRSQNFTYDSLNRIATGETTSTHATSPANCWGEAYFYDNFTVAGGAWGNLTAIASPSSAYTGCTGESLSVVALTNNRLSGYGYDSPGNLTSGSGVSGISYNAENQLVTAAGVTYKYDGDGKRVQKSSGTLYWYGNSGDALDETGLSGNLLNEYVFFGGQRIARRDPSNNVFYYFADHLGTSRTIAEVASGQSTAALCYDADFYPFGGERTPILNTCSQNYKFTGKERDTESNLDNFGARYDASNIGRFMNPDSPSYSNHKNPQSWNLYAYSLNNPVTFKDADGHEIVCVNNVGLCGKDAATATGNADAASRVTTNTVTTQHSFLGVFHWTTSKTVIAITGDINSFRSLSQNANRLADLVTSSKTVTVNYTDTKTGTWTEAGETFHGGSDSRTPSQGWEPTSWIDPNRTPGVVYDQDAVDQGLPQSNTAEEFGHEVLGHIWGEMFGGAPAGTRANMRDSITGENAVRALDPTRGQKGVESHHNYKDMPPDPRPKQ